MFIKCILPIPVADTGDCSLGVTVNVIESLDTPPDNTTVISTYPTDSTALYSVHRKLILMAKYINVHKLWYKI